MANALSKVNYPSVIAAVLALVSIFQPWWGLTVTFLGNSNPVMYGLFGPPSNNAEPLLTDGFKQTMSTYSPIILAIALITMALSLLGSFVQNLRPLAASLVLAIATLVGYSLLLNYALNANCGGNGCIRDISGSQSFLFNTSAVWGFQTGFYLFLAATVLIVTGLVYHQIERTPKK